MIIMNRGMCEFDVCDGNTEESYATPRGETPL